MVRFDITQQSVHGTWIDGYLPGLEKMRQLAQKYRYLDNNGQGLPQEYGFSEASEVWEQEDFFGAIASAMRTRFDYENLLPDVRPAPCFMWLVQISREPSDAKMASLYQEYSADTRKKDYYHLITIHDECPVAEGCLQQVIQKLNFEVKLETAYIDKEGFINAVHESLTHYVDIMAAPWLEVEKQLDAISDNVVSVGP